MWRYRFQSPPQDTLSHYGIQGQKWGIRRFQFENGSYTPEGKERYRKSGSDIKVTSKSGKGDGYEYRNTQYKSKGTDNGRNHIDELAANKDYDSAFDLDLLGSSVVRAYKNKGKDQNVAKKALSDKVKDYDYEFNMYEMKYDDGEEHISFYLSLLGNNYMYEVSGDDEYTDDQQFSKRNK